MAEHVAGATVVVIRLLTATIGGILGTMVILAKRGDVMTMLCLPCGRLPSKTGREQGRQKDGEQCRSNEFGGAAHVRILSHICRQTRAHQALHRAVGAAYGRKAFSSGAERVAFLFELYRRYTSLLPANEKKKRVGKERK